MDAGLRFAVKVRSVVEPLKHEPLVDAVNHFASLFAGGVETQILQDDETAEGNKVPLPPGPPVGGRRMGGGQFGSPALRGDAPPFVCTRLGILLLEVPQD